MSRSPHGCDCRCDDPAPECSPAKAICTWPGTGVMRRCLTATWHPTNGWSNETPHKVTTFTGVAAFEHARTCVTDIAGRIWRKRATPQWHIYDIVHTASDPLRDLAFVGAVGVAVGDSGTVLRSSDSGATWSTVTAGTTDDLVRVVASGRYWYLVGNNGSFLKSSDNGVTFTTISTGSTEDLLDITVIGKKLWIAGSADLLRSTDRGVTWSPVSGVSDSKTSVVTDNDETTWVFTFSAGTAGKVWKTVDQGATWTAHTLSGTVNNVARVSLFYEGFVYVASSGSVTAPTLSQIRSVSSQESISRFGIDLYICGANAQKPAPTPPSLCPTDASATMWTVNRIDSSVEFGYCSAGVAFADTIYQLIQDPLDPNWSACFWKSKGYCGVAGIGGVPCTFPGPFVAPFVRWELDTSSDPITLTFIGSNTAVYELPLADWNHNAANLMRFVSGTGGDTNHEELWLCPGDFTESDACRYCWDRCNPYGTPHGNRCWEFTLTVPTSYQWCDPTSPRNCDPVGNVILDWLTTASWPASFPMRYQMVGPGIPSGICRTFGWIFEIGDCERCDETGLGTYHIVTRDCSIQATLAFGAVAGLVQIQLFIVANDGDGLTVWNALYELATGEQTIDCTASHVLTLTGHWQADWSFYNTTSFPSSFWVPNAPWLDLPATITISPVTCP